MTSPNSSDELPDLKILRQALSLIVLVLIGFGATYISRHVGVHAAIAIAVPLSAGSVLGIRWLLRE